MSTTSFLLLSESFTHPVTGVCGVLGYTGDGISKSLHRAIHTKTMRSILVAKQDEAEYCDGAQHMDYAVANIVELFCRRRAS